MRLRIPIAVLATAVVALVGTPAALADSSVSTNWAGYAVHRSGVRYRTVSAVWRQPTPKCTPGNQSYSAVWVGLGGYSTTSTALEQIGTEVDCSLSGRVISSAWYELVPAPSETVGLTVRPGDLIGASVGVVGHRVTVTLNDMTRHHSFTKAFNSAAIDVTSAEWIVEAPSDCISNDSCQTLPLANFGRTDFVSARAKAISGAVGSISSHAWTATEITLAPGGRRFAIYSGAGPSAGGAVPSKLNKAGSAFSVSYEQMSGQTTPFYSGRRVFSGGSLVHPGR